MSRSQVVLSARPGRVGRLRRLAGHASVGHHQADGVVQRPCRRDDLLDPPGSGAKTILSTAPR